MHRTTIYLPDDLRTEVARIAEASSRSAAEVVREAVRAYVASARPPRPKLPLVNSKKPLLARAVDDALDGFGEG